MKNWSRQIQDFLRFRRQAVLAIEIPFEQVKKHLEMSLLKDIVLKGRYQPTGGYWGTYHNNILRLHGPKAYRQFCFSTEGKLSDGNGATILEIDTYLSQKDVSQLLLGSLVVLIVLMSMFRLASIFFMLLFFGFLYAVIQWNFQYCFLEIKTLLSEIMRGNAS